AKLLMDIQQDEDTAEILLQRADRFEEDQTGTIIDNPHNEADQQAQKDVDQSFGQMDFAGQEAGEVHRLGSAGSKQGSHAHLPIHKNKKKKVDHALTEITTGTSANSSLGIVIGGLLLAAHLFAIIIYCVSMGIYLSQADRFETQLSNLERICDVAYQGARMAPLAQQQMIHEFEYNFQLVFVADGMASSLRSLQSVRANFADNAEQIVIITSSIYDLASLTDPWEEYSVEIQIFQTGTAQCNDTNGDLIMCEGKVIENQASHTNLLRSLTELAQKASQMSQTEGDPHQR
ncbi:MAG: hypothetical protein EZS28_040963, partial [Streblomastix strix]